MSNALPKSSDDSEQGRRLSWSDVLPIHPDVVDLFPKIGADDLAKLGKDIQDNGLRHRIELCCDPDGKEYLVDGANRLNAIEANGIDLVKDGKLDWTLGLGDDCCWDP
jgi:hypothetical protein